MKHFGELRLSRSVADRNGREKRMWQVKAVPDVMIRLKRLFPRADHQRTGEILLYDTPEVARDLQWVMERWPLRSEAGPILHLVERADEHRRLEKTVHAILSGERRDLGLREPARPARDYQQVAADLAVATGHQLLMDEVGLGKTFTSLLVLLVPEALPALVVTLTDLPHQWADEIAKTLPWLRVHLVRQLQPYDPRTKRGMDGQDPDVLIMPWSKLRGWGDHLAGRIRTVIFDEVQELRRPDSLKYAAAAQVADAAKFALGLSATPVYNYGGEAYNIVEAIAPDQLGSREEFAREWCGGQWSDKVRVTDPAALGVYLREQGIMLRRTRKEVGRELPEVIRVPHTIALDLETLNRLSDDAVDLASAILSASTTREERFLASGQLDWRLRHATGVAKAPFVAEFVKLLFEADEQVILYGWHHDVYAIWAEQLAGANPLFHTGRETPNQKRRHRDAFLDGETRVLVMSLRTGAGLDGLQDASKVAVFGELDWSPGIHEQCLDSETEILTRRGFLRHGDVHDDDEVAAFDVERGVVRWCPILRTVNRPLAAGEAMYALQTPGLDLRVTGGHRMVLRHRSRAKTTDWYVATASEVAQRTQRYSIPVAGQEECVRGLPLSDAQVAFLGWWITDGNLNRRARQVTIHQAQASPFHGEIQSCLDGCGLAWSSRVCSPKTSFNRRSPMVTYTIPKFRSRTRAGGGWGALEPYLDKDLSPLLDGMDARQLAIFLKAAHGGDGNKQVGQSWTQRSYHIGISRRLFAERLQSLCVRRGWRANLACRKTAAGRDHWTLHTKPEPVRSVGGHGKPNLTLVPSVPGESVWCVANDLGTLVVRRNGKTAIIGNCIGRLSRDNSDGSIPEEPVVAYFLVSEDGSDPVVAETLNLKQMQSGPIHDPERYADGAPLAAAAGTEDRVRRLAEDVLRRRRTR